MTKAEIVLALLLPVAYLAGFLTFKVKGRWCPKCGRNRYCMACDHIPPTTVAPIATAPRAVR